ncbi:hypothetical protein WICPIJ_009403 [Wickerhamomyces pijperi]|uniref:Uncharacterized protein n=1 Tax=Wickerhamomyces pijperi TaxID=599730 RepID=A0A9P8TD05_WICPI|nr:hypothetical protein WICPIJ_009403 [Wickerhamomyces pijperi]
MSTNSKSQRFTPSNTTKERSSRSKSLQEQQLPSATSAFDNESTLTDLERRKLRFSSMNSNKKSEQYGLLSRGEDNRLQRDPEARVAYFKKIQQDFTKGFYDSDFGQLTEVFDGLSLKGQGQDDDGSSTGSSTENKHNNKIIDDTLMSLRKLRESMLKITADDFTKSVFLFSIRISSRIGHYQTYLPSITYLLNHQTILTDSELKEIAHLYILHVSHFTRDDMLALELCHSYCPGNLRLLEVLQAMRTSDYLHWLRLYHNEKDTAYRQVMKFALERMVKSAIRVITKAYFQLPKAYVEDIFKLKFEVLKDRYDCQWKQDEDKIVIRQR